MQGWKLPPLSQWRCAGSPAEFPLSATRWRQRTAHQTTRCVTRRRYDMRARTYTHAHTHTHTHTHAQAHTHTHTHTIAHTHPRTRTHAHTHTHTNTHHTTLSFWVAEPNRTAGRFRPPSVLTHARQIRGAHQSHLGFSLTLISLFRGVWSFFSLSDDVYSLCSVSLL